MSSPSSSSTESSAASSVANNGWNIGILGPVGDYAPFDIDQNRHGPQVPVYLFAVYPQRPDPEDPVSSDETDDDEQEEYEHEQAIETEEIVLSSDSEVDSDSDESIIYIGTYKNGQSQSDQREAEEDISEETDFGDHDERFRDHFCSN